MQIVVILFGFLVLGTGMFMALRPRHVAGLVRKSADHAYLHAAAVITRAALGTLLILLADDSRFPVLILVLGWLTLVAAFVLAVIGRRRFIRLMHWALGFVDSFGRVAGAVAAGFGVFLIYAFL